MQAVMPTRRILVAALFLACAPKSADTGGESGSSTAHTDGADASSAGAPTTSGATTNVDPTVPPTATSADGSASATSNSTTTGTDTGGPPSDGLPGACASVCMFWQTCAPDQFDTLEQCEMDCLAGVEVPSECAMTLAQQWNCVAALPCDEALKFLDGAPTSCQDEQQLAAKVCDDPGCGGEISGGDDFCELEQDCGGKVQNYHCDTVANLCTCTENDVAGAECPADGFCAQGPDEQRAAITACCGWVWM